MSRVSELLKLPGTVASGVFSRKGILTEFEGPFSTPDAELAARLCAANIITMEMQGRLLAGLAERPGWDRCYGWAMWGPEMAIITVSDGMCAIRLEDASLKQVIGAMRAAAGVIDIESSE